MISSPFLHKFFIMKRIFNIKTNCKARHAQNPSSATIGEFSPAVTLNFQCRPKYLKGGFYHILQRFYLLYSAQTLYYKAFRPFFTIIVPAAIFTLYFFARFATNSITVPPSGGFGKSTYLCETPVVAKIPVKLLNQAAFQSFCNKILNNVFCLFKVRINFV